MIAVWMLYCLGIGLAFVIVGHALERGLHLAARATRWAWVIAIVGSYVVPVAAWVRPEAFATFAAPIPVVFESGPSLPTPTRSTNLDQPPPSAFSLADLDLPLRWMWSVGSFAILLALGTAATRLISQRRRWRVAAVDGLEVLISRDVGPAVAGLWSPRVVVPEWLFHLPREERELMLAHEQQHIRSADPVVIALGFAFVLLAPWNIALWWQWRRLRLAVEIDCDARVVAQGRSAPAYGQLLLRVGSRRSPRLLGVAAFGEPASFLESRIRRMVAQLPRWRWARAGIAALISIAAIVLACETPRPSEPGVPGAAAAAVNNGFTAAVLDQRPQLLSAPRPVYPELLRRAGIQGRVVAQAIVDTTGRVEPASVKVRSSANAGFIESAKHSILTAIFRPARVGGRAVRTLINIQCDFRMDAASGDSTVMELADVATELTAERLRPEIDRWAHSSSAGIMMPTLLAPSGPPMDVFLIADAKLRVYRSSEATLYYLGNARPSSEISIADLKSAAPFVDPSHDGWLVVNPRALRGLVRDNVRVIWIHHDPEPQDSSLSPTVQQELRAQTGEIDRRAQQVRGLARQYHPEVYGCPASQTAVALVLDSGDRVLAHAAKTGEARGADGFYADGEDCRQVLERLLPEYRDRAWSSSGCTGDAEQHNVIVYWAVLLSHSKR